MKAFLILLFVSLVKGDKLNSIYLPPPGANYSGGGGDIEVPFEVPAENFGTKDDSETRLTPGIFRDGGIISSTFAPIYNGRISTATYAPISNQRLPTSTNAPASDRRITSSSYKPSSNGRIISSTYAPNTYPSTTLKYNSSSTTPKPHVQSSYKVTDGLSKRPNSEKTFFPNQYSDIKGGNIKSPFSSENHFENDDADSGRPVFFGPTKTINNNDGKKMFYSNKGINTVRYPEKKIRPQEEAERNAVILNYENVITPDGFAYSFDTSNGIHADEIGTASDGVKANGSYSYIGDDGKFYNITYSADEHGFRPRGDHLPTPPPVPDAILKVIEQVAKDRDNGIFDDGSYDENKYGFKKYQPVRDRILENNYPRLESSMRQNNGLSFNEPSNISDSSTIYKPRGPVSPDFQGDYNNNEGKKGNKLIEPKKSNNQSPNEAVRDYQNQDSQKSGFPSAIQIPGNKINIHNDDSTDGTTNKYNNLPSITNANQNNRYNYDVERISDPGSSFVTDDGNERIDEPDFGNTFIESQNGYSYPNPNRQFGQRIPNQPSRFDQNNDPEFTQKANQFASSKPREYYTPSTEIIKEFGTDTVQPNNYYSPSTERVKESGAYTDRPNDSYGGEEIKQAGTKRPTNSPSSTERVSDATTFTDRTSDYYNPSSTDRLRGYDTYTDRPRGYYSPSSIKLTSTKRIKPTGSFTQPSNYYISPSSTEIQQIGTYYTERPNNNYYHPTSTETSNKFVTYTDRPNNNFYSPSQGGIMEFDTGTGKPSIYYGPSSTNRTFSSSTVRPKSYYGPSSTQGINEYGKVTGRPSDYYNSPTTEGKEFVKYTVQPHDNYSPSSTERIKDFGTASGRPTDYYAPSSTKRIKDFGTASGRPTDYYAPSSTERINDLGTATGRPTDYYAPSSTERIKDFGTASGRLTDYYAPSSTERIKDFGTASGRPTDYYAPSSTERIKDFGTASGRPTNYYAPSSSERIKYDFGTATGRPIDYYAPSSTARIKDFGTATSRPTHYYAPSSTERVKDFGVSTGRPTNYYAPSSTERINDFGTATGRPTHYYSPSSTERIKDFGTATGRPIDYYAPSSTERIKDFGTASGRPTDYYAPSSTERVKDFGAATGRPTNYYAPSSTERINDFGTVTGRPIDYYGPSSTERVKDFGAATGRPTNYYAASSTESTIGEDFSGPKQPQRYDPETGYHY